ncbi:TIR domain-containing protein [Nodosilinea sp. P-1105]|uniref:TIR domain-containing protein n=1 Tax=Nodosilinea sp. P-1105 TaxID=2546229 RepID=UPI00146AEDB7|nr:TIR domain-containing protein [Nodosilinea sp. P-1105]NMF86745.1 TIR domain-containing protein [Nodosilinea sp. P-1105]
MTDIPEVRKILILAANPKDTVKLRLDQEVRDIQEGLQRAKKREQFIIEQRWAVRPRDIQRALLDVNPQILHFLGHGTSHEGLVFEDNAGNAQFVSGAALASLFALFADQLECVVLNGCYSANQAQAIAQHIPFVVGLSQAIDDRAAIEFAVGFYDALGAGRPVKFAHQLGCSAIQLAGLLGDTTPVLLEKAEHSETGSAMPPPPQQEVTHAYTEPPQDGISLFFSYAHEDEELRNELAKQLKNMERQGIISAWYDRDITAGEEWAGQISYNLETAQIVLLLISSDFMDSDYCYDTELKRAMERHRQGDARVIPVILRPTDWKGAEFEGLQALPKDALPVTKWPDRDEAFLNIAQGIRRAVESTRLKKKV